ncbi:hypothetical protein ACQ86O_24255 [Serratia sp. L9]|uniref:hypothetical protein n=1 Tax=Serratia sp. L9 TaxID=3423946 RepID=UPI003D664A28
MTEITTVKENWHNGMVRFGLNLAWSNLSGMVILFIVLFSLPEETAQWVDTAMGAFCFINISINLLVFCFALVGLFKSTLKWSAFLVMAISIVIFIIYLGAMGVYISGN